MKKNTVNISIKERVLLYGVDTPEVIGVENPEGLAAKAFQDSCHKTNPRPCSEEDLLALYREAYKP